MFLITSASLERAHRMFSKLQVNTSRMLENLELSKGFSMSEAVMMHLAREIGRGKAYSDVKKAIKAGAPEQGLREVLQR